MKHNFYFSFIRGMINTKLERFQPNYMLFFFVYSRTQAIITAAHIPMNKRQDQKKKNEVNLV